MRQLCSKLSFGTSSANAVFETRATNTVANNAPAFLILAPEKMSQTATATRRSIHRCTCWCILTSAGGRLKLHIGEGQQPELERAGKQRNRRSGQGHRVREADVKSQQ